MPLSFSNSISKILTFVNFLDFSEDKYTNDGFCPPSVNTYTYCGGNINISPDSCKLDVDCGTTEKCCFYGCNSTCKEPKDEPGKCLNSLLWRHTFQHMCKQSRPRSGSSCKSCRVWDCGKVLLLWLKLHL